MNDAAEQFVALGAEIRVHGTSAFGLRKGNAAEETLDPAPGFPATAGIIRMPARAEQTGLPEAPP